MWLLVATASCLAVLSAAVLGPSYTGLSGDWVVGNTLQGGQVFLAQVGLTEVRLQSGSSWRTISLKEACAEPDPLLRANKVRDRRQELARQAEAAAAGPPSSVRCEVQEMWADKTYVLFTYERLRDVRIVYVPPMSLGCFGGDTE